jgi:hypothetical protein
MCKQARTSRFANAKLESIGNKLAADLVEKGFIDGK